VVRKIREEFAVSDNPCAELRPRDITDFAQTLSMGRTPSTVQIFLNHLSAVLSIARTAWGCDMNRDVAQHAITVARQGTRFPAGAAVTSLDKVADSVAATLSIRGEGFRSLLPVPSRMITFPLGDLRCSWPDLF
jgi:hypothetical protein